MKKFALHMAYIAIKECGETVYGDVNYWVESEVKPKVTTEFLEEARENVRESINVAQLTILNWQWFDW